MVAKVEDDKITGFQLAVFLGTIFTQSEKRGVDTDVTGPRRWRLDQLAHGQVAEPYSKTQD